MVAFEELLPGGFAGRRIRRTEKVGKLARLFFGHDLVGPRGKRSTAWQRTQRSRYREETAIRVVAFKWPTRASGRVRASPGCTLPTAPSTDTFQPYVAPNTRTVRNTDVLRFGHSPDPDDAFMFYGLAEEAVIAIPDPRLIKADHEEVGFRDLLENRLTGARRRLVLQQRLAQRSADSLQDGRRQQELAHHATARARRQVGAAERPYPSL